MPDSYTPYRVTDSGDIIDPPVIPEYERRLTEASAAGDTAQIAIVTEDYHGERKRVAERHNQQVQERRNEDERLRREARESEQRAREQEEAAQTAAAERAEADRLRRAEADRPDQSGG
jgi:hypothetical protein